MIDRSFSEVDLRTIMDEASGLKPDVEEGRWIVESKLERRSWHVIVEPDRQTGTLLIVTAYPIE